MGIKHTHSIPPQIDPDSLKKIGKMADEVTNGSQPILKQERLAFLKVTVRSKGYPIYPHVFQGAELWKGSVNK